MEHIYLESDEIAVPEARAAQRVQARVRLRSVMRGATLALDIFDYYYLSVHARSRGSAAREYVLDLRFVAPSPEKTRRIPGRWIKLTLGLVVLSTAAAWWLHSSPVAWWQHGWIPAIAALFSVTAFAVFLCAYRSTETLIWLSAHGRVKLIEFTGGLGTFRACRAFEKKLAAHVRATVTARKQPRERYLRDEMREHSRLRERGVLSAQDYETSKARILRGHDVAAATGAAAVSGRVIAATGGRAFR